MSSFLRCNSAISRGHQTSFQHLGLQGRRHHLKGQMMVNAPVQTVMRILTAYEQHPATFSSLLSSKVLGHSTKQETEVLQVSREASVLSRYTHCCLESAP